MWQDASRASAASSTAGPLWQQPTQLFPAPAVQPDREPSAGLDGNATNEVIDLFSDDDDWQHGAATAGSSHRQRSAAAPRRAQLQYQMGVASRPPSSGQDGASGSSSEAGSSNPFWHPARYMPQGGEMQQDMTLRTNMTVFVLDAGLQQHPCRACLDTGEIKISLLPSAVRLRDIRSSNSHANDWCPTISEWQHSQAHASCPEVVRGILERHIDCWV